VANAAGYVFYGFWDYRFCALMAASTLISFVAGLDMTPSESLDGTYR
jgi:hypothetical protein